MEINWLMVIPFLLYLALMLAIGVWASRELTSVSHTDENKSISEFYLARRSLGTVVLMFTMIATWASAGAFVGAPGQGFKFGYFVLNLALPASGVLFLTLGGLGKKLAIVARKVDAVTLPGLLRARFQHPLVGICSAIFIVVFLTAMMTAQFIGGARILETLTGFPYSWGVILTGVIVVCYAVLGGFRAVTLTDTIQGILIILIPIIILIGFLVHLTGIENLNQALIEVDPKYITPNTGGMMGFAFIITLTWMAIGISAVGNPGLVVRVMSYKSTKNMHRAILIGTPMYFLMAVLVCVLGTIAILIVGHDFKPGDMAFPNAIAKCFPAFMVGIIFAGPFAAIMSTVDSILLLSAAGLIEDIYVAYINPKMKMSGRLLTNRIAVGVIGIFVFIVALFPAPPLLYHLIWYAAGGLAAAFIFPLLAGLYWPRANKYGAIAAMLGGSGIYILSSYFKWTGRTVHAILPGMVACVVLLVVVSLITKEPSKEELEGFWA